MVNEENVTSISESFATPCIAILLGAPFTEQNLDRIGMRYMNMHAKFVIFNCSPWIGRFDKDIDQDQKNWGYIENINNYNELHLAIKRHLPKYAIDFIGPNKIRPEIQICLNISKVKFVVQKIGALPNPSILERILWKCKDKFQEKNRIPEENKKLIENSLSINLPSQTNILRKLISLLKNRFIDYFLSKPPDLALLSGSKSIDYFTSRAKTIIWSSAPDYHIYNQHKKNPQNNFVKELPSYVVFIDDCVTYASDWEFLGINPPVTPEMYFSVMSKFFDMVENLWGVNVVIAAHPNSKNDVRIKEGFGNRLTICGMTAELVSFSKAVLLHASTGVSFAALADKPIFFISTKELSQSRYGMYVRSMAKEFNKKPIIVDGLHSLPKLQPNSTKSRLNSRYVERYLRSKKAKENRPWGGFLEYLEMNH